MKGLDHLQVAGRAWFSHCGTLRNYANRAIGNLAKKSCMLRLFECPIKEHGQQQHIKSQGKSKPTRCFHGLREFVTQLPPYWRTYNSNDLSPSNCWRPERVESWISCRWAARS